MDTSPEADNDPVAFANAAEFERMARAVRLIEDAASSGRGQGGNQRDQLRPVSFWKVTGAADGGLYPGIAVYRETADEGVTWTWTEKTGITGKLLALNDEGLTTDKVYMGMTVARIGTEPLVSVTVGGGAAPFLARITGAPDPADYPPPGDLGGEYDPPRFSYHVYTFTSIDIDNTTGIWTPGSISGVGYRSASTQYPPPKMIPGQTVMAQESVLSPGYYILTPWGSQRQYTETHTTRVQFVCTLVDGVYTPYILNFQRKKRTAARDLCVSSATSEE